MEPGTAPVSHRPWMVPAIGAVVDRPEFVAALVDHLLDPAEVGVCVTVEGAGGVGKTILAAIVCRRDDVRRRYPGGLVWVTVGEQTAGVELADLVNGVSETLTGVRPAASDPRWAGAALGEALDRRPDTLLVLDDVWSAHQVAPFLLGGVDCRRLITTRNRGVVPRGSPSVMVDTMTSEQAAEVLQMGLERPLPPASRQLLLDRTGRWPVLLGLVNAAICDRVADGATAEQAAAWLADRLQHAGPTALDVGDDATRDGAVASTIAASVDQLGEAERELYWLLAIFPEDIDIPADVLALLWQTTRELTSSESDAVRERLVRLRLVIGRWVDDQPAVRIHDVIRDYLRHRMTAEQRTDAHRRLLDAARTTLLGTAKGEPTPWWALPPSATYLWRFVPWHVQQAGNDDELVRLLMDLRWVAAKVQALGAIGPVEADLALADTDTVRTLRQVVAQNAHMLTPLEPGDGLGPTLASRLAAVPGLEAMADAFAATLPLPYLSSRWPLPDVPPPSVRRTLSSHPGRWSWVTACSVSRSGELIASADREGIIRVWRTGTWDLQTVLTGHFGVVRDCLFTPDDMAVLSAGDDGTVRLWDADSGTERRVLHHHSAPVTSICVIPDGSAVVSTSADGAVHVIDIATGQRRTQLNGHTAAVTGCALSPDGRSVVTTGADRSVRLWDLTRGVLVHTQEHTSALVSCAVSGDGRLAATTSDDGTWLLWELPALHNVAVTKGHSGRVAACSFSPDSKLLATAGHDEQSVGIWDVATTRRVETLIGHPGYVRDCTFAPYGRCIVSAGADQTTVWNLSGNDRVDTTTGHRGWVRGCAASRDGRWLATGGDDRVLRLWDAATGTLMRSLEGHTGWVRGCAFSPDGTRIASAGDDRTLRIWRLPGGEESLVLAGHEGDVMCCALSPDGQWLASGSEDQTARIWNAETGECHAIIEGHGAMVSACGFSPDGVLLATGSADHTVRLWNTETGSAETVLHGHEEWVNACSFTHDGKYLVTGSGDGTASIWHVPSRQIVRRLAGHTHWIRGSAVSPDDRWVATTGADRTIRVWDFASARCLTALRVGARLTTCCWITGSTIGVAGDAGVYVFTFHTDDDDKAHQNTALTQESPG